MTIHTLRSLVNALHGLNQDIQLAHGNPDTTIVDVLAIQQQLCMALASIVSHVMRREETTALEITGYVP